jgi:hypothetical protein
MGNWKGSTIRTLKCVGDGTTYDVWVSGTKDEYDPFGAIQITSTYKINSYNTGSLAYQDTEPTGTYSANVSNTTIANYANSAGSTTEARVLCANDTMKVYANNNNEVNFGGSNASEIIYFGYRATDSKPIPTKFVFGSSTGTAQLVAKQAVLSSTVDAGRYNLRYNGTAGLYGYFYISTRGTACTEENTAGTSGVTYLMLGNSTAVSKTVGAGADNAQGILRLYGTNTGYVNIRCGTHTTESYNLYLPGDNG